MSQWHRENPDLCGTDADPAMLNEGYRRARNELMREGLIYAAAQGDGYECEHCGAVMPLDPDDDAMRRDAAKLGIELGPRICDPCFDAGLVPENEGEAA